MCETMRMLGCEAHSATQVSHELHIGVNMGWNLFSNKPGVSELKMFVWVKKEGTHIINHLIGEMARYCVEALARIPNLPW